MSLSRKAIAALAFISAALFCHAEHNATSLDSNNTKPVILSLIDNNLSKRGTLTKQFVGVYFTASWCQACRHYSPKVVDFHNEYGEETDIVIVSIDNNIKFYDRYSVPWLVLKNSAKKEIVDQFNIKSIPAFVLIDKTGNRMTRQDWKKRSK